MKKEAFELNGRKYLVKIYSENREILTGLVNDGEVLRALKKVGAKKISRYYLTVNRVVN